MGGSAAGVRSAWVRVISGDGAGAGCAHALKARAIAIQGGSQVGDQFRQQWIWVAAMQPRQGFSQGPCQGLEPARLL